MTLNVYRHTRSFPRDEQYGLTAQLRRASLSIGANLAEGCGRRSDGELARFILIATGSASELDYELLLARDLDYLDEAAYGSLFAGLEEVRRMMTALHQTVYRGSRSRAPLG